jgi:hypothetical protein
MQTGTVTVTGLEQSVTPGESVDAERSILIWTAYSDGTSGSAKDFMNYGRLKDGTTLLFGTNATAGNVYIAWTLYEFSQGVNVQHYYSASKPTSPISIDAVDLSKSWLIASYASTSSLTGGTITWKGDTASFYFASSNSVTMNGAPSSLDHVCLQVIQWEGAKVQSFTQFKNDADITINAVDTTHALLFGSTKVTDDTYGDAILVRWIATSTTLVDIVNSYSNVEEALFVVELPQVLVQRAAGRTGGIASLPWTVTINKVDTARSCVFGTTPFAGWCQMVNQGQKVLATESLGRWVFNSATQIAVMEGQASPVTFGFGYSWQVMTFRDFVPHIPGTFYDLGLL